MNDKLYNVLKWVLFIYAIIVLYLGITQGINQNILDINRNIVGILAFCFVIYSWYRRKKLKK